MAIQTTYNEILSTGRAGFVVNSEPKNVISRTIEDAAGLEFGKAVVQGVNDAGIKNVEVGDTVILGVSVIDRSIGAEATKFSQYDNAAVMVKGVVFIVAGESVAAGDEVYVTLADGSFGKTAGAGIVKIENARFETSASASDLAAIRLA